MMNLRLRTPPDFSLAAAVCSHGFFVLAPNRWDPAAAAFRSAVALDDRHAVSFRVTESPCRWLHVAVAATAGAGRATAAREAVRCAVRRMLRLDENLREFHRICRERSSHRRAADLRFGRLLRNATLFEDMVKVICTCNITWRQTVAMVGRLVSRYGVPCEHDPEERAFPTPPRLAAESPSGLRRTCLLGYRAEYVCSLARAITDGRLDLRSIESGIGDTEALFRRLREIRGIGPYAAANLCMLLGRYDRVAVDSEMVRFLRERTGRDLSVAAIQRRYAWCRPYAFLAYWWELWSDYERRHGPAALWHPDDVGRRITSGAPVRRPTIRLNRASSRVPRAEGPRQSCRDGGV